MEESRVPDAVREVDARGLKCPLPVLRTQKVLQALPDGGLLRVLCTDPMARIDIPHLVQQSGSVLVEAQVEAESGVQSYLIRKKAGGAAL